jgi:sortase (surface protein transpeptidase)
MLSFELSVIDIVLVIAIIAILLLYAMKTSTKNAVEQKLLHEKEKSSEPKTKVRTSKTSKIKEPGDIPSEESSPKCHHHLGYLKTLPLGSTVPEECYLCPQMMRCLFSNE